VSGGPDAENTSPVGLGATRSGVPRSVLQSKNPVVCSGIGLQNQYGPVFDALMPKMSSNDFSSWGVPSLVLSSSTHTVYAIQVPSGSTSYLFFIQFVKDSDGVWRIESE
jgi:hypothetical protein